MRITSCRSVIAKGSQVALGALAIAIAAPSWAQTATPVPDTSAAPAQASDQAAADAPGEVVVTGSRIRGVAAVGSNVISVDQAQIAQEPVTNTNDLLRRVPQVVGLGTNRAGGSAQNGAANVTRGAGINLRGLGIGATLLLYDGQRFPAQGLQGQFTDPSVIPTIALSRVEVVADGASAIYGSDAISGVVNFILRKDFNGIEAKGRLGISGGDYSEKQASMIAGHRWDGGWAMIAGEYNANSALRGYDLPFYQDDNRYRGGRDLRTTNCNPGTITVGGNTYAIPTGGVTASNVGSLVAGTSNKCFYQTQDAVIPEQQRVNVVGAASQELGDHIRLFANGFYSRRWGTTLGTGRTVNATVRNTNPFFVSPVAGATSVTVAYHLLPEIGPEQNPYAGDYFNLTGGVEAKLFSDFRLTAYYSHGRSYDNSDRVSGVNATALANALADTNPATALNVFGGPNNPATLAKINDAFFVITGKTQLDVLNAQVDGSLFSLPGGKVRIAFGAEHRREYFYSDLIQGSQAAQTHTTDSSARTVDAVFGELYIPIFSAENGSPGMEQLSLSAAGRYENYSDSGHTTNPKFGITYKPIKDLTFKASYGTSFRAPTYVERSSKAAGAGLYFDTLPDTTSPTGTSIGIGIAGGNPSLVPETAKTWSFTGEFSPSFAPGLVFNASYFRINYYNQILSLRGTPGILNNPQYAAYVTRNPSATAIAALVNSGLPINGAINQSLVTFIVDGRRQNIGTTLVRGIDFGVNYDWSMLGGKFDVGLQGTYFTQFLVSTAPGSPLVEVSNTINYPQKFRAQATIGGSFGGWLVRVTENHLSPYLNNSLSPVQRVSPYDTVDFSISRQVTENLTFGFDVRNLFDRQPPFVDTTRGYDPQSADPVGRLISANLSLKF